MRIAKTPSSPLPAEVSVLVLCAEWCVQCRAFRPEVADLLGAQLRWVDIEDADLDTDALGIQAFPSVAICRPAGVLRYLGPVRAEREAFLIAVERLKRLPEQPLPEALRALLAAP